jgi:hypothetical protein
LTQHLRPTARHRIAQDAAATTHVDHPLSAQSRQRVDPVEPQRIDLMQGAKFAVFVPPAMRQVAEFRQLLRVGVDHGGG